LNFKNKDKKPTKKKFLKIFVTQNYQTKIFARGTQLEEIGTPGGFFVVFVFCRN